MNPTRKLMLLLLISVSAFITAQENKNVSGNQTLSLYPKQGTMMFEVNFKPFGSNEVISIDNFNAKYFINDATALRLGVKINNRSNKQTKNDWNESEDYPTIATESSIYYGFRPGIEYHFLKNRKVSPYAGFELNFGQRISNAEYEYYNQSYNNSTGKYDNIYIKEIIQGGWITTVSNTYTNNGSTYSYFSKNYGAERSFTTLGSNVVLGTDFYFVKNLYFGFELGLGYNYTKNSQIEVEISNQVEKIHIPSYSTSTVNFYYNNAIRLGVWF